MTDVVKVIPEFPPNIDVLRKHFPITGFEIFAYSPDIYNPSNNMLPVWLVEHEKVHFGQQKSIGGPEEWWDRFIADEEFRLEQELEAHRVEYRVFCSHNRDRNRQFMYLMEMGKRLGSPMYGGIIRPNEAMTRIRK